MYFEIDYFNGAFLEILILCNEFCKMDIFIPTPSQNLKMDTT
jgi:hypothetical protein